MPPAATRVFISYSHDSPTHVDRVLELSDRLRAEGIDCLIDQYEESPPEGWPLWCIQQVEQSEFVLVICTETYERRFCGKEEPGHGKGVTFEGFVISQELYDGLGRNAKFIPVVFAAEQQPHIPIWLRSATNYDISTPEGYQKLYGRLTKQPLVTKPELGRVHTVPTLQRKQEFPTTPSPPPGAPSHPSPASVVALANLFGAKGKSVNWRQAFVFLFLVAVVVLAILLVFHFWRPISPPAGIPSLKEGMHVIVLPFDVQNSETLGYVGEGLGEELSRKLSALPSLHVVSSSAATEQAKRQKVDLKGPAETIGRNFGINLIVHGTVQQGGGWTRIDVDFDDVADARRRLTKAFSYPAASINLLDLEDQVYKSIVKELRLRPTRQEQSQAASPTSNSDAYDHYLQGRFALGRTAIGLYQRAIQEDPQFALAYVGLSNACLAMYRDTNDPSWIQKSLGSAQQAQKLNDELPEVHLALGDTYRKLGKTQEAIAEFDHAKKVFPNSDLPWLRLGRTYEDSGQQDQAIDAYTKATQLDPYSLINRNELGAGYLGIGEFEKALDQFRSVISLDPSNYFGYMNTGVVHFLQGEYEQSILDFEKALQFAPDGARDDANIHSNLGTAYFYMRRYTDSVKENVIAVAISPNDYALAGNLADAYRWSEQKTKAAETYKRAIELARKQIELNPRDSNALGSLALYYVKNGNLLQAEDCIRSALSIDPTSYNLIFDEATVRTIAKQPSAALESLRLAFEKGYSTKLVQVDPEFSSLHSNPNFQKLITEYSTNRNR